MRAEARPDVDEAMVAIGNRLADAARAEKAYGLAAAHIGEIAPIVVITAGEARDYLVLYNPRVAEVSAETERSEEGSVSLPGVRVEIERPVWAVIAFMTTDGRQQTIRLDGFAARVALHEIEQTQGIFFLDKVSRLKRDMAVKKAKKYAAS